MKYGIFRYSTVYVGNGRFPFQPYRSETYRISLFHEHQNKTNDYHTKEIATVRNSTAEVVYSTNG